MCVCVCVYACVRVCVCVRARACVCVCLRAHARARARARILKIRRYLAQDLWGRAHVRQLSPRATQPAQLAEVGQLHYPADPHLPRGVGVRARNYRLTRTCVSRAHSHRLYQLSPHLPARVLVRVYAWL